MSLYILALINSIALFLLQYLILDTLHAAAMSNTQLSISARR